MKRLPPSELDCGLCWLATTERGPRAVPRLGSECAAPRCARGSLRCSRHEGGCGTAVRGAERAANLTASSPVRRLRRRTSPRVAALLAGPHSPRQGTALGPHETLVFFDEERWGALAKPRSGVRRQRHERRRAAQPDEGNRVARKRGATASMSSSEHRRAAQQRAGHARARGGAALGGRAAQGTRSAAEGAAPERRRIPGRGFASLGLGMALALRVWRLTASATDH